MQHLPPIASNTLQTQGQAQGKIGASYFTRGELIAILRVYGRRVAMGDWRDYAIDHLHGRAVFSIYRSHRETPIFTIEKHWVKSRRTWQYALADRRRFIKTAQRFEIILRALTNLPRLVQY